MAVMTRVVEHPGAPVPADLPSVGLHLVPQPGAVPHGDGRRARRLRRPVGRVAAALGGLTYLQFLAPGLLAATVMQSAAFEATFPIIGGLNWQRTFHAMYATPLSPRDIALGNLAWIGDPARDDRRGLHDRHRRCSARRSRRWSLLGDPGRGPDRDGVRGADRGVLGDPADAGAVQRRSSGSGSRRCSCSPGTFFPIEIAAGSDPADRLAVAAVARGRALPRPGARHDRRRAARWRSSTSSSWWRSSSSGRGCGVPDDRAAAGRADDGRAAPRHRRRSRSAAAGRGAADRAEHVRLPPRLDRHRVGLLRAAVLPG